MAKTTKINDICPIDLSLNILSGKWKLKILWELSNGKMRFNQLQKSLPNITTRILTDQLRTLEEEKIIKRTVFPEVPPKVEYSLTEIGISIFPILEVLCEWGKKYKEMIK